VPAELDFLTTELGFDRPHSYWAGHDQVTEFVRGNVRVTMSWDGARFPIGAVHVDDSRVLTWSLSPEEFAEVIRTHPETLSGDFAAMQEAELLEPIHQVDFAIHVMQTPGQRRPRLPKMFQGYKVYRLRQNPYGFWEHDGPIR
jgi:hypothetical protein